VTPNIIDIATMEETIRIGGAIILATGIVGMMTIMTTGAATNPDHL
jgi:hypothetical protein